MEYRIAFTCIIPKIAAHYYAAGARDERATAAANWESAVTAMPTPSRSAAAFMSSGTGRPWQISTASMPASEQTAIALRWF